MRRFVLAAALCLIVGGLGGLLAAGVEPSDAPARYRFVPPHEAPFDFRLRDQDGQERSIAAARGKVLAITFLFSTCHDLCPAEASLIGSALERVGDGVLAYAVSVDPASDTPERARAFIERRGLDPTTFKYLLGTREQLAPVWKAYGIAPVNATPAEAIAAADATDQFLAAVDNKPPRRKYVAPERDAPAAAEDSYPDPSDFAYRGRSRHDQGLDFEHSAYVMLIDKHGRQRVGIPFEQLDVAGLAADLAALLNEP